jgi:hypothetical protein
MKTRALLLLTLTLTFTISAFAGGHPSTYSNTAPRDSHGKLPRRAAVKGRFQKQAGFVHGRSGVVVRRKVAAVPVAARLNGSARGTLGARPVKR